VFAPAFAGYAGVSIAERETPARDERGASAAAPTSRLLSIRSRNATYTWCEVPDRLSPAAGFGRLSCPWADDLYDRLSAHDASRSRFGLAQPPARAAETGAEHAATPQAARRISRAAGGAAVVDRPQRRQTLRVGSGEDDGGTPAGRRRVATKSAVGENARSGCAMPRAVATGRRRPRSCRSLAPPRSRRALRRSDAVLDTGQAAAPHSKPDTTALLAIESLPRHPAVARAPCRTCAPVIG